MLTVVVRDMHGVSLAMAVDGNVRMVLGNLAVLFAVFCAKLLARHVGAVLRIHVVCHLGSFLLVGYAGCFKRAWVVIVRAAFVMHFGHFYAFDDDDLQMPRLGVLEHFRVIASSHRSAFNVVEVYAVHA
jgi:hypothetical protein